MLGRPRLLAYAAAASGAARTAPLRLAGQWRPALGLRHQLAGVATAVPRRAFAIPAAEHPLDEFFEPPNEADPENLVRYAGRAWKMEELRNKVRGPARNIPFQWPRVACALTPPVGGCAVIRGSAQALVRVGERA